MKTVVLYYMNGCIHCERFMTPGGDWDKLQKECKGSADFKEMEQKELYNKIKEGKIPKDVLNMIDGYPTIVVDGKRVEDRSLSSLKKAIGCLDKKEKNDEETTPIEATAKQLPQAVINQAGGFIMRGGEIPLNESYEDEDDTKFLSKYLKYKTKYFKIKSQFSMD